MSPRPHKFDRVMKYVAYETTFIPLRIEEKKGVMTITFSSEDVSPEDIPALKEKLRTGIPYELNIEIE